MRGVISWLRRLARKGQTTSEYVIILGLVALGSIGVILLFGNQVRVLFGGGTKKLADEPFNVQAHSQADDVEDEMLKEGLPDAISTP